MTKNFKTQSIIINPTSTFFIKQKQIQIYLLHRIQYLKVMGFRDNTLVTSLLFSILIYFSFAQKPAAFNVLIPNPINSIDGTGQVADISVCFADCQSCTPGKATCEKCFAPWFVSNQAGNCQLVQEQTYVEQSTEEERRTEARIPSAAWFLQSGSLPTWSCSRKLKNADGTIDSQHPFNMTGPMRNDSLIYRRTISEHDYLAIKFYMVLSNWCENCELKIRVFDEENNTIASETLTLKNKRLNNSFMQDICKNELVDRQLTLSLSINERTTRQIFIHFNSFIPQESQAEWGVGSFTLLTGKCNSLCETCTGYSSDQSKCQYCKYFLSNSDTNKCDTCSIGFSQKPDIGCQKCDIKYKACQLSNNEQLPIDCQYAKLADQSTCTLDSNPEYNDEVYLGSDGFFSSLFSIEGSGSSTLKCGDYSIVGPARFGQYIRRFFVSLPPHLQYSLNFNVFIIDQDLPDRQYRIVIRVDGQIVELDNNNNLLTLSGTSNQCKQYDKTQAMGTFSTPNFIKHEKVDNVTIEIGVGTDTGAAPGSQTSYWGLRDFRIVYRSCDENCINCTKDGCITCKNNLALKNMKCDSCVGGAGFLVVANSPICKLCSPNCLECQFDQAQKSKCKTCVLGFYLYESGDTITCQKEPNVYEPTNEISGWTGQIPDAQKCSVKFGETDSPKQFIIAEGSMKKSLPSNEGTFKKKVSFYLLKVDDWEDLFLDIYINDLLVYHKQFDKTGRQICYDQNQNDQVFYEEFLIEDNNETTNIEFQVVDPEYWKKTATEKANNPPRTAKFGISEFKFYRIGCAECENQKFNYKLKYNMDNYLKVHMEFNRVYINNSPQQFKNIFQMQADGQPIDYQVMFNDSIRYILRANVTEQILNKNVSVICKYPQKVITNIELTENLEPFFEDPIKLMQSNQTTPSNPEQVSKTLETLSNDVEIQRFSPLGDRRSGIQGVATFFAIISRIVIYLGLASFLIGCQTPCTHFMHNLQKIWIHIFVAALAVSPVLKTSLRGFRQVQDQNIAIYPRGWESGLPQYLYYDSFAPFQQYYQDINFWRNIYSVGVAALILILVYVVMRIITSKLFNKRSQKIVSRHLNFSFSYRPLWYFNSIVFYQYFTVVMACIFQFTDIRSRTSNIEGFNGITIAATIVAFIFVTVYPIVIHLVLARKRRELIGNFRYEQSIEVNQETLESNYYIYNNKYSEIFFRFKGKNIWSDNPKEWEDIDERQFFYNILRFGQLWWIAVLAIGLSWNPFVQAFLLMLTTAFHLIIILFFRVNYTNTFRILKALELLFFLGIEIIIVVMERLVETLRVESYETLGIVGIIFIFLIILVSFLRMLYTFTKIYQQYKRDDYVRRIPDDDGTYPEVY